MAATCGFDASLYGTLKSAAKTELRQGALNDEPRNCPMPCEVVMLAFTVNPKRSIDWHSLASPPMSMASTTMSTLLLRIWITSVS